ncbi:tetratricopeptide repeat-containing sensor histidine kinase [Fulvivirga ligni]|uniref:tetratricopeptide repeat-containing sensor histidine kinase n=1 Tax=Fulvivirga ligni TaxID=2904246 RepID=UPI001F338182|nr:tetratricopeptide repeat-containing sensor histidine kinase [Fulvivirga ligni]UII20076.1 tetratricopeptide repeat-containing sensor histidine kinase [Fulvivirga ligni]
MNRRLYILLILITSFTPLLGQSNTVLNLETQLSGLEDPLLSDSARMKRLLHLIDEYGFNNVDTSIFLTQKAYDLAVNMENDVYQAITSEKLAVFYNIQSNYRQALKYDLENLRLARKMKDLTWIVSALNNIGEDYYDLDLFNDAFEYYQTSLKEAEKSGDTLAVAISTYNIGRVLKSMGQLEKAMEYIENSLKMSRRIGDKEGTAYSYHDIGEILILEGQYEKALEKLNEALLVCRELSITVLEPQIMHKLAQAYEKSEKFQMALQYHDSAQVLYEKVEGRIGIAEAELGKGIVYVKVPNYEKAIKSLNHSLEMAESLDSRELMIKCYLELSNYYEHRKMFETSLDYYKKYKALQDSLFGEKKSEQFAQIQIKYETANKDIEIAYLNQKEEQRNNQLKNEEFFRNILVVILAFTAVLLITLYRSGVRRKKINMLLIKHQEEMEEQSREMASLLAMKDKFFSILSHDLRSPINALVGILTIIDSGHITQEELREHTKVLKARLENAKKLLGNLLDWAMVQMDELTIQNETLDLKELVEENITFFRETNDKHIQFFNKIDEEEQVRTDRNMLDLVIRNLISNAIKFTEASGFVEITAEDKSNDWLYVRVTDNGIGMSEEQVTHLFDKSGLHTTRGTENEEGTGLGLKLCKEFIERMGGELLVESKENEGTTFTFTVKKEPLF